MSAVENIFWWLIIIGTTNDQQVSQLSQFTDTLVSASSRL